LLKKISRKVRNGILKLLRLGPNDFSFLGGIFIATSVNLYTGVFAADVRPGRWVTILTAGLSILVSGFFWSAIAWNLGSILTLTSSAPPESVNEKDTWEKIISPNLKKLGAYLTVACVAALIGLIVLLF